MDSTSWLADGGKTKGTQFVVRDANHGTACALLLAGKPILQLPIYLEQGLFAERVTRTGTGLQATVNKPDEVIDALTRLLAAPEPFAKSAAAFAARHRDFDPQREHEEMVQRIEELASTTSPPPRGRFLPGCRGREQDLPDSALLD